MLLICESKVYPGVDLRHSSPYRQVLIELGPSYFKYLESGTNRPTVLAKLLGFYTIEIRNIESGTVQAKADLLVMENLFFGRKIVKTFDLKGIQGRKVKAATSGTTCKPLFDGDWIEGAIVWRILEALLMDRRRSTTDSDAIAPSLEAGPPGGDQERLGVSLEVEHHGLLAFVGDRRGEETDCLWIG